MQAFNALKATLSAESAVLQSTVSDITSRIRKQESVWKDLQSEHSRIEMFLAKANEEQLNSTSATAKGERRVTLKETLTEQINEQEQLASQLNKVRQNYMSVIDLSYCFKNILAGN